MISIHYPALIVITPLFLSFIVFVVGYFKRALCFPIVVLTLGACVHFAFRILRDVLAGGVAIHYEMGAWAAPWGIEYVVDYLNAPILVAISVIALLVAIYSETILKKEVDEAKIAPLYTLFLLQVTGLLGMTITGDVFNLYVLLEIASFTAYAMIAMGTRGSEFAAFRYIIFGTIGACSYLLGVGYLYIITGSLNMADLSVLLKPLYHSRVVVVGFVFLLVGIGIKMALFPMHTWLPDSYSLAPSGVSVLLAPLFTKVGAYVLIRVLFTVFDPSFSIKEYPVMDVLGWIATVGVLFAGVLAVAQRDVKRMLCYLMIAEIGYIVLGVASANRYGLTGAILHIVNDMFMMACLFTVASTIHSHTGSTEIGKLQGLSRNMPVTIGVFVVGALSVVGVPPMCGFFSKWYLVLGMIEARQWIFLAAFLLSSLLSAVIFFRVIEVACFKNEDIHPEKNRTPKAVTVMDKVPYTELVPMVLFAVAIIVLGLSSGAIIRHIIRFAVPGVF